MKVKDAMTPNPVFCKVSDTAQSVAKMLRDSDIGSIPVLSDGGRLEGMITDRDLCCTVVAEGLDPKTTRIEKWITPNPITCRAEDSLEKCEQAMAANQVRRIPVVDESGRCIGIVAQADLALKEQAKKVHTTVAKISQPTHHEPVRHSQVV